MYTAQPSYPPDWEEIAWRVKERAGWRCEGCGAPHGLVPHVLTTHHLNYDRSDCRAENLIALCQCCHLSVQGWRYPRLYRDTVIAMLRERASQGELPI